MAFIVEDGTAMDDSTSFVSLEYCDDYHVGHVNAAAWTDATSDQRQAALMMATRIIEATVEWIGIRKTTEQALGWPRSYAMQSNNGCYPVYYDDDIVPKGVKDATCELARELLKSDRTLEADTMGIKSLGVGQGAATITFDAADRRGLLTDMVNLFLRPFGTILTSGGSRYVNVFRV